MKLTLKPSGFNYDINAAELPPNVWNLGSNVVFNNGYASAAPGWTETSPGLICTPVWLLPVLGTGIYYWIYAGNNTAGTAGQIGVTDGTTHWDITPAAGLGVTAAGDWTGGILNGIPVFNNRIDPPMFWDRVTTNPAQTLPAWPADTTCQALRPFKYHLIAMGIADAGGEYPDLVLWSSAANPGALPDSWTPEPDNDAGNFAIAATPGIIIDGGPMRDQFVIYKQHSTTIMGYIAGQFVFSNRKAFVTSGILARNCWAEMYGQHYVLTDGDFIIHNGQEVRSLIDGINREFLFDQIDADFYSTAHLALSHDHKQVWINWPKLGHAEPDTALVYDIVSGAYGLVDFDFDIAYMCRGILNNPGEDPSFDARTDTFDTAPDKFNTQVFNPATDLLVFCRSTDQKMFSMDGFLRDGAQVPILLQMLSKDLEDPQAFKLVQSIWPHAESDAGLSNGSLRIRVGIQRKLADPVKWSAATEITAEQRATMMAAGRYISLEITAQQIADWRLNSIDMDYNLQGTW